MTWTIRPALAADVIRMQEIEVDAGRRFLGTGYDAVARDDPPAANVLLTHVDAGSAWVVAERVDDVELLLGYSMASIVDGEAHLDQVSVIDGHSGRGIGRALVLRVDEWAAERGLDAVTLTTYRDLRFNAPFYRTLGYADVAADRMGPQLGGIRDAEVAAGLDALGVRVAMRKALAD